VALKLLHLLIGKVGLVRRVSLEGQRVVGVLRVSLVVNIALSVLPVGELCLVVALLGGRCVILGDRLHFALVRHYLERLEGHSVS
jgi:hypothetical protein